MSHPEVSVLMSVYNGEPYLREAIDSILNQTFQDFEFVVVDDGSTDSSPQIIHSYKDPRIKLIRNETNIGLSRSLNRGIDLCRGKYIARMDSDDISLPARLGIQIEHARKRAATVLGSWVIDIDQNGKHMGVSKKPTSDIQIKAAMYFFNPLIHSSVMIDANILKSAKYNERFRYSQDYELWIRMKDEMTFKNIACKLIKFRWHSNQVSESKKKEQRNCHDQIKSIFVKSVIGDHEFIPDFVEFTKLNVVNTERLFRSLSIIALIIRRTKKTQLRYHLIRILKDYILRLVRGTVL